MSKFLPRREAIKILGIHHHTLYAMAEKGEIESLKIGSRQVYNVDKYLKSKGIVENSSSRRKICYCRVISGKYKDDLKRQIKYMEEKYPTYEIISETGSALNCERKGLLKIIDYAIKGEIDILVVEHRDRLAQFGYELIEHIIKTHSGGIIKLEKKGELIPLKDEISKDMKTIMSTYSAKEKKLKKYNRMIQDELLSETSSDNDEESEESEISPTSTKKSKVIKKVVKNK